MILLVLRLLPESLPREKRQVFHPATISRNYFMVLRNPQFVMLSLALGQAGFTLLSIGLWATARHYRRQKIRDGHPMP